MLEGGVIVRSTRSTTTINRHQSITASTLRASYSHRSCHFICFSGFMIMSPRIVLPAALLVAWLAELAAALPTATSLVDSSPCTSAIAVESPSTTSPPTNDLRKRQANYCGYNTGGTLTCYDPGLACEATLLANGQAYQYCSTPGASLQALWTTMYAYGDWQICPAYAYCW